MKLVPESGITLHECLALIPDMAAIVEHVGLKSKLVRSTIRRVVELNDPDEVVFQTTLIIHPTRKENLDFISNELIQFEPVDAFQPLFNVNITEMKNGLVISWRSTSVHGGPHIRFPDSFSVNAEQAFLQAIAEPSLNEFGLYYVAMFICGMYSRYYPDLWMKQLERSEPLALSIETLCDFSRERLPLLTLSELTNTHFLRPAL